jgi:maltose alpha-D-glucosyltransferase/alpha-amylase
MGENLRLPEREAIRTPMQWSAQRHAEFSTTDGDLLRPVMARGPYGYQRVNVTDQRRDPDSLLSWFERMLHTHRECREIGIGDHEPVDVGDGTVLVHRADAPSGTMLFLHNLSDQPATVSLPDFPPIPGRPVEMFADREYDQPDLGKLDLDGYGYRWIRLTHHHEYD